MAIEPGQVGQGRGAHPAVAIAGDEEALPRRVDLKAIGVMLRRRWKLALAITLAVFVLAVGASVALPKRWTATAQLKIDPNARPVTSMEQQVANGGPPDQAVVDTEVGLVQSLGVGRAVVEALGLVDDPEFGSPAKARGAVGDEQRLAATTDKVLGALSVTREGTSYLVNVAVSAHDPDAAARIANAFADKYLAASIERRLGDAAQRSTTLDAQLSRLGREVEQADARVAQYRVGAGITQNAGNATITDQQIAPLSDQLATAESEAAAKRATLAAARSQAARGGLDTVSGVLTSNVIGGLRQQRAEILRKQGEVAGRYGPRHPQAVALTQQLDDIDRQIQQEARRTVSALDSDARAADASAASLRARLAQLRGQQASNTRASVEAESLERDAEAKRTTYTQLAQAAQQSTQQRQNSDTLGRIVQRAVAPLNPSFPNRPLFAVLGLMLGALVALATLLAIQLLSSGVESSEDVERLLGIPFLVSIEDLRPGQMRRQRIDRAWDYVVARPLSPFAESLRAIRAALLPARAEGLGQVLAICSALPAEGKTTVAATIARVAAMSGDRAVVVNCDLRRNALGDLVEPNAAGGLVELLQGRVALADVIVRDPSSTLDILPLAGATFQAADLFSGERMQRLLARLRGDYDLIVLDTPPLLAVADARVVAAQADVVLMVVRWHRTSAHAVRAAMRRLGRARTLVAGAVLSRVDLRANATSASDPARYAASYAAYYHE